MEGIVGLKTTLQTDDVIVWPLPNKLLVCATVLWTTLVIPTFAFYIIKQWFPTGEEFLPREEFHEFRGGISTFYLSYLFVVQ